MVLSAHDHHDEGRAVTSSMNDYHGEIGTLATKITVSVDRYHEPFPSRDESCRGPQWRRTATGRYGRRYGGGGRSERNAPDVDLALGAPISTIFPLSS